jgi:N-acetylmuramoyl-L-alanine amidase
MRWPGLWITCLLVAVGAFVGGCQPWNPFAPAADKPPSPPRNEPVAFLTVQQAAGELGLEVVRYNTSLAKFANADNNVLIIADPHGQVHVNGRKLEGSAAAQADYHHGTLLIPETMVKRIRPLLRTASPKPRRPKPSPATRPTVAKWVVVLDAGHGGKDPGAIRRGSDRRNPANYEKTIVLDVTQRVARLVLRQGVAVVMTRDKDVFVDLDGRVKIANRMKPNLFVSIHADSAPSRLARGFTVYYPRRAKATSRSHRAGKAVANSLAKVTSNSRGLRQHEVNLRVLERVICPAILVELGYLSNTADAARLASPVYRSRLATAIAEAIVNHLRGK